MKMMDGGVGERFTRFCKLVTARGKGITLGQLGDAHALARELEADDPDPERIEWLARRLRLDVEDVEGVSR